jgi:hypothetical protein
MIGQNVLQPEDIGTNIFMIFHKKQQKRDNAPDLWHVME